MLTCDVGDLVRLGVTFTDATGTAGDPTVVKLAYKPVRGTVVTLTYGTDAALIKSATGVYYADVSVTAGGDWVYRWTGTGALQAATEGQFVAALTAF